jgi:uncharacterized protein YcbX
MNTNTVHVSDLLVYPIKSCAGVSLSETMVGPEGILFDRLWRVVDEKGDTLTQRQCPRMALIRPEFRKHCLAVFVDDQVNSLLIPWAPSQDGSRAVPMLGSVNQYGIDVGDGAAHWFSTALGVTCRLMRVVPAPTPTAGLESEQARSELLFVGYPLLVISEASLADLNERLENGVLMNRFRPNIILAGGTPYQEESWSGMSINDSAFHASDKCDRCSLILVDQELGAMSRKEPLRTLAKYRKENGKVMFGRYFAPKSPATIAVGDKIVSAV